MGPQVNKFEQVTSDCHQMSLAGGGLGLGGWGGGPMPYECVGSGVPGPGTVVSNTSWGPPCRQTDTHE